MNIFTAIANTVLFHGASILGALFRKDYLDHAPKGEQSSKKLLLGLLRESRNTEFGRKHGFSEIRTVEDYQKKIPLSGYADYRDYINRTARTGEQKLITNRRIRYFARTSGTVSEMKLIPQVQASYIPHFKNICLAMNDLYLALRQRGISAVSARGLIATELHDTPVNELVDGSAAKIPVGPVSSYSAKGMKLFLPIFCPLPREVFGTSEIQDMKYVKARYAMADPDLKYCAGIFMSALTDIMSYIENNCELLIRDIETGTIDPSVRMSDSIRAKLEKRLRPNPKRAAQLRRVFAEPSDTPLVNRIWTKMSFVWAIGTADFEPFTKKMRTYCSSDVPFSFACYSASEAVIGCATRMEDPSYLLMRDSGFFEFLPVNEAGEAQDTPLLAHELEEGKLYEIVVTNLAGLYRYRLRDVVRVKRFLGDTPYIEFAYRSNFVTNFCSMHITGELLATAAKAAADAVDACILDYSLYADAVSEPPKLVLFAEADRPLTGEEHRRMQDSFESTLSTLSWPYTLFRTDGVAGPAEVQMVKSGTYLRYRDEKIAGGASMNQLKAVRLIDTPEKYAYFSSAVENPD